MRLSTLAALMILTTIMLSACSQEQVAQVIDNSGQFYGRDAYPRYSAWNPAPTNPTTEYKYQGSQAYGVEAEVGSVTSQDLPPPAMASTPSPKATTILRSDMASAPAISEWQWPVRGKVSTANTTNEGIVIAASEGTPIRASGEGTVAYIGNHLSDYGNIVILRHANGMMTSYAHAREILVSNGDHVRQGDLLGYVGHTGNAKASQLHFSMRVEDASVDPLHYLPRQLASN